MHQMEDENGLASLNPETVLQGQQAVILNQIDVLTRDVAIHSPSETEHIYALKQEYNQLVKIRAELTRNPLSDPMEVLPPDLWPDIIRNSVDRHQYPVNKLLDLTSVSKGWCSVLTTLPVIWTDIRLDQCEPDYLAKAMMCIQLSGECKIDLNICHLTAEEWREISSMIVPEGRRIRRLAFKVRDTDYVVIRQVLGDFTKLPVLQDLFLRDLPGQLSDQQYIHTLLTESMPSMKTVYTPRCTIQDQIWNPYLTSCSLEAESLTKEAVETLMLLPRLNYLIFTETPQTLENIPSLLKSSFGSLQVFMYKGADICRRLTWIGNDLSTLSTHYPENGDANALLVALSRFPRLHELTITVLSSSWAQTIQNNAHMAIPRNSVSVLRLETFVQDRHSADWNVFFPIFFPASPFLDNLSVWSGIITDMGWNSIQSIKNLRVLHTGPCSIDDSSLTPVNMESLRYFGLNIGSHGLAQSFARLESKSLQTLRLAGLDIYPAAVTTVPHIVAGAAFPNITTLVISTVTPLMWELGGLSKLRALELHVDAYSFENHMTYWVSDVLEAILMRPRDTPALETITLGCIFIEWDILLLMLERKNFLNEHGISSIKTLVLIRHDPPYHLLYPLSELLGGRFVERDPNYSFSLEAIGERIWNESIPGCMRCHYSLWGCDTLVKPLGWKQKIREVTGGDKANEYLVADPPLPLEMAVWLSGRRERRINFIRRYKEPGIQLNRPFWCDIIRPYGGNVITGDALVGAHFEVE